MSIATGILLIIAIIALAIAAWALIERRKYRRAHEIALRERQGAAGTEELRKAMQYYRSLFEDVLEMRLAPGEPMEVHHG
jgi:hypothetical protein